MIINYYKVDRILKIELTEEIDQHTADKIRRVIDDEIERYIPRKVVFDFYNITFMDSSGIGMILGRYKLTKLLGGEVIIINANKNIKKIFNMSGVTRIIKIDESKKVKILKEHLKDNIDREEKKDEGIV